ncbi:MAG: hypothetical protein BGP13_16555 [Sphingobacteriales bacterium 40-81]|nr:MAG: hypothetical protein BGP13_16555 [Sphingobacteriales bacterium 40-81]
MKKLLLIICILTCYIARAQYNNEWIDYNKTYYKFPVGKNALNRISQSVLQSIGLANTPAEQFQLWRNGVQVPVFTSVASGTLGGSDYIEFWGEMNDGKTDAGLYPNINFQLCDKWSLETDTASYFLTVNPSGNNLRLTDEVNNVAANVLPAEQYFMHTEGQYFKNKINSGWAQIVTEYVYSSIYDRGEGYTSRDILPSTPLNETMANLYPYISGPNATFTITAAGNAANNRNIVAKVNGTTLVDVAMDAFYDQRQQVSFPASSLNSGSANVAISNTSANPNDRMVVGKYEITYPRQFNFGSNTNFLFELSANTSGNYLRINFNYGSTAPILYDLTNYKRYTGVIDEPGIVKFALLPSNQKRKLVLVSRAGSNIVMTTGLQARNFVDYSQAANQGNYLIISNSLLYSGANGNPVEAYRLYRSSAAGGSYDSRIYDIDQLTDQFAFGIKRHPFAIKKFLKYARSVFSTTPSYVFLIGKGVSYVQAKSNESNALLDKLNLVPPYGYPASDNLYASNDNETLGLIPIGRLSAVSANEVEIYLNKVKEYEAVGVNAPQTVGGRAWMKNIVHAIGGGSADLSKEIGGYMNSLKHIIEDTLYGGNVESFSKTSAVATQLTAEQLGQLFAEGIGIVNYFGHSSASTTEFNIDDPYAYQNKEKYPLFLVNGCLAGDIFNFESGRLSTITTLSERYLLANQRGAIGFVASTHFGIVSYLNIYLNGLYKAMSGKKYGASLGETLEESFRYLLNAAPGDYLGRLHAEEITLNGDPAVKLYMPSLPDYAVESSYIEIPSLISATDNNFDVHITLYNLGKAHSDSVSIIVKRVLPGGETITVLNKKIDGIRAKDSFTLTVPINPGLEKGENKLIVSIDPDNSIEEISEVNNTVTKAFYIIENVAAPVYPGNFSIIKNPNQLLYASTAYPLSPMKSYIMEIDTTAKFNSVAKVSRTVSSPGGLLEFNPQIAYKDSTVYYWRVSLVPSNNEEYQWADHSFMYKVNTEGYNQSHFYQHQESTLDRIYLDSSSHNWNYTINNNDVYIRNCIYQSGCQNDGDFVVSLNNNSKIASACVGSSLVFNVIDSATFKPWKNVSDNGSNLYLYGSASANCGVSRNYNFEFKYLTAADRKKMMDFMDIIPNGAYVIVRSFDYNDPNSFSSTWKGDTALYGHNNSLYHKLKEAGFEGIDSVNQKKAWIFVFQKGNKTRFTPLYRVATTFSEKIYIETTFKTPDSVGYITSPKFGPAKQWEKVIWSGHSVDAQNKDFASVEIIGIDLAGTETSIKILDKDTREYDISSLNVAQYPYLKLKMRNADSTFLTPFQLDYWRILYKPVPEGAILPSVYFNIKDTLQEGEIIKFNIAFKNISDVPFDSLLTHISLIDKNNVTHFLDSSRRKAVIINDSVRIEYQIDSKNYPGTNTIRIEFNPDNDQPEQYLLNNFLYKSFYVVPDNLNPLLDVTFDGVHILNNDIIAAKPHILIKLKDENNYMLLDDTSLAKVQIRYPDNSLRTFSFNSDTLKFTPATATGQGSGDNTATIDFNPAFFADGDYQLIVSAKDKSGNSAGQSAYTVSFKIINKPMISNMFNYPNPFTTSTAFVFTLTGSEVPQNLRIQILTITGKIVKEITKQELGPIRIGRNITEYKWDGTDQYGQKLANGVYLYRVITNLNGKSLEKYKTDGDNTDQYFNKGYGKMYLMR